MSVSWTAGFAKVRALPATQMATFGRGAAPQEVLCAGSSRRRRFEQIARPEGPSSSPDFTGAARTLPYTMSPSVSAVVACASRKAVQNTMITRSPWASQSLHR